MELSEKLFEGVDNELSFNAFVDYLTSINNGYHSFDIVDGGYRYVLSNPLKPTEKEYLKKFSNVRFGKATYKYAPEISYDTVILTRPLDEDIEKISKGKWTNKGKEGTHGTFRTKKQAREQQKAMYANGYKGESLKEVISSDIEQEQSDRLDKAQLAAYKLLKSTGCYAAIYAYLYQGTKIYFPKPMRRNNQTEIENFVKAFSTMRQSTQVVVYVFYQSQMKAIEDSLKQRKLIESLENIPSSPAQGSDTGMTQLLNDLMIKEIETVNDYTSAIATAIAEQRQDIADILIEISNDEQKHIGSLSTALSLVNPQTQSVVDGMEEAKDILNDNTIEPADLNTTTDNIKLD